METIAVLFGMEQSFPPALVEAINRRGEDVRAEFLKTGGVMLEDAPDYTVIVDRISQDIPFYRAIMKHAALNGTRVINNPFWWTADDKFFNYALGRRLGVEVPRTAILPSKEHPPTTSSASMRNLIYPLNWDDVFAAVGFPAWLKPFDGGGWKHVYKVHNADEFFNAYHQTGDLCMMLQEDIEFEEYYRCYVIGRKYVHIMPYEPRNPMHLRYEASFAPSDAMRQRITQDCLTLCGALGYDMNTVEFAVRDGIPYAIDYMNAAPDAERDSIGEENFNWIVEAMATYAIEEARKGKDVPREYRWSEFMYGNTGERPTNGAASNGSTPGAASPTQGSSAGASSRDASDQARNAGASGREKRPQSTDVGGERPSSDSADVALMRDSEMSTTAPGQTSAAGESMGTQSGESSASPMAAESASGTGAPQGVDAKPAPDATAAGSTMTGDPGAGGTQTVSGGASQPAGGATKGGGDNSGGRGKSRRKR